MQERWQTNVIKGIGIDIVEIARIEKALERTHGFAKRILTPLELVQFNESKQPARFLAKRFAAKEAVVKALGTGIAKGVSWQHLEIVKEPSGRPSVVLRSVADRKATDLAITQWSLSYSDEQQFVVAQAIAEG